MATNDSFLNDSIGDGPDAVDDGLEDVPDLDEITGDAPPEPVDLSDPEVAGAVDPEQSFDPDAVALPEDD
jgi:hypothetical protein